MTRVVGLLMALALVGCSKTAVPATADGGGLAALKSIIATCAANSGEVQVRRSGQAYWETAATGAVFRAGDWVRTGKGGSARVEFLAGGGLELGPEAVVVIDSPPAKKDAPPAAPDAPAPALVAVQSGEVRGFIEPSKAGAPAAPVVLRTADGRELTLEAEPDQKRVAFRLTRSERGTEVAVTEGAATLHDSEGTAQPIKAGESSDVTTGKAAAPVRLIDFPKSIEPGIDARFASLPDMAIKLAWRPVPGATAYRLQVARDLSFQMMLITSETRATSYTFKPYQEGLYAWRVATRDDAGRFGEFGFARRIYVEHDQPRDLLVGPEDGAVYSYLDTPPHVEFTWQSAANARAYRLVVATTPNLFASARYNLRSTDQKVELPAVAAGEYLWGAFVDGPTPEPIFLKPRKLVVKKGGKSKIKAPDKINKWGG